MKPFTRALGAILFGAAIFAGPAGATPAQPQSRALTPQEAATFLPLACAGSHKGSDGDNHCSKLIGLSTAGDAPFELTAILYGSFSHAGSDQAYVTFFTPSLPHADNFGGGILFVRANASWRLERWFPGWQMDRCAKVPNTAPQRVLCATGFSGQGETTSSVWVWRVPASGNALVSVGDALLRADDTSGINPEAENGCYSGVPAGRAWLTSIESIEPATTPPYFAVANVTYETSTDIASACAGTHPRKVRITKGQVRFRAAGGNVTAVTPVPFVVEP